MLFTAFEFVFLFLPAAFLGFLLLRRLSYLAGVLWLTAASLFFYAVWNPAYLGLLVPSIVVNYALGRWLDRLAPGPRRKAVLAAGIAANLGVLAWFKYAGFLVANLDGALGSGPGDRRRRAAARHLLLHLPEDRLPGRFLSRPRPRSELPALRPVRELLPAADRRADRPSRRDHAAAAARPPAADRTAGQVAAGLDPVRRRPVQEGGARRRRGAAGRPRLRRRRRTAWRPACRRPGRRAGLHAAALLRLLGLFRHGHRPGRCCSASGCRSTSIRPTRRPASSTSGGAGT